VTPPPSAQPAEPEKPLPSLVQKDEAGKIKPLTLPTDEAAVRLLDLDDQTRAKVEKSISARREEIDRMVVEKIDLLMEVRTAIANLPASPNVELMRTTAAKARTFSNNKLLDRLVKDGALSPAEKARAAAIAKAYGEARKQQIATDAGTDMMKGIGPLFLMTVEDSIADANMSLDHMLAEAAPRQEQFLTKVDLPPDQRTEVNKRLADLKKKPAAGKTAVQQQVDVLRTIFLDILKPEQQRAFLTSAFPRLLEEKPAEKKADEPAPPGPKK
jgi:hypothetical protein